MKFHDVGLDDAVVASGGVITATVNIIAQGNTESTRNGRKCTIKAIQWRYRIGLPEILNQANPANTDTLRVIMYLDKQCNGATAATLDLLETADFQSFRNLANTQRFDFLHDKVYSLNYTNMAADAAVQFSNSATKRSIQFYKKCNIPLEFNSNAGAIGEIRSNNIGVLLVGSDGTCSFESKIRLRFSDISAGC